MILFVVLIAYVAAFDKDVLKNGLESVEGQVKLFSSWMKNQHKDLSSEERAFRFRVFRKNLKEIVSVNSAQDSYELDANFMAGLTKEEQTHWYGINITLTSAPAEHASDVRLDLLSSMPAASQKLWRNEGKVTWVRSQGSCGSCWAHAAVAAFEGHYAIKAGILKDFSEQELLDCTYNSNRDGCQGGWYHDCYNKIKSTQHLARFKDYPYQGRDGACLTGSKPNGMTGAKVVKYSSVGKSRNDAKLVAALGLGPVSMAFPVTSSFNYYKHGILSIPNCGNVPTHGVTVTGYTAAYFEIKNSWGSGWGESGYVRFDRKIENMCGISSYANYPVLEKSGTDKDKVHPNIACFQIGLKSRRNGVDYYVSARSAIEGYWVASDSTWISDWEKFTLEKCPGNTFCLRTAHGLYLKANPNGVIDGNASQKGTWERFTLKKNGDKIALKTYHGKYVSIEGKVLVNKASNISGAQMFSVSPGYCLM